MFRLKASCGDIGYFNDLLLSFLSVIRSIESVIQISILKGRQLFQATSPCCYDSAPLRYNSPVVNSHVVDQALEICSGRHVFAGSDVEAACPT